MVASCWFFLWGGFFFLFCSYKLSCLNFYHSSIYHIVFCLWEKQKEFVSWHAKEKEWCSTVVPTTAVLTFCCVWLPLVPDSLFYEQSGCFRIVVFSVILQNGRVSSESSDDPDRWQSIFAAVTDRELRLYESAPWSPEAWGAPVDTCPLLSTRLECYHILITKSCLLQLSWYFLQVHINTLRTGSFKLFKRPLPGFLTILTL